MQNNTNISAPDQETSHYTEPQTILDRHHKHSRFSCGLALVSMACIPLTHADQKTTTSLTNAGNGIERKIQTMDGAANSVLSLAFNNEKKTHGFNYNLLESYSLSTSSEQGKSVPEILEGTNKAKPHQLAQSFLPPAPKISQKSQNTTAWTTDKQTAFQSLGFDFSVTAQAHSGRFDWSIGSDMTGTRSPNILSELTYDALDINILTYDYVKRFTLTKAFTGSLEISYSKGGIDNGTVYDADYFGDYRTDTKSLSESDPAGSDISGRQVTLGLTRALSTQTQLTFLGGYAQNNQAFVKRQGVQLVSARNAGVPAAGTTFNNLNSTYKTTWKSGFIGTQLTHTSGAHRFKFRTELHGADYYAEADWNLRAAFQHPKSFEHLAGGSGLNTEFSYSFAMDKNLLLTFSAQRERWQTRDGLDRVFLTNGQTITTRLVETNWESTGYGIGITYVGGL